MSRIQSYPKQFLICLIIIIFSSQSLGQKPEIKTSIYQGQAENVENIRIPIPKNQIFFDMFSIQGGSFDPAYDLEDSIKKMVDSYFPVVESVQDPEPLSYHRQSTDNLIEVKHPGIFDRIDAMSVDFNNVEFSDPTNDPYGYVHDEENKIRDADKNGPELEVNQDVIELMLNRIFDSPRSTFTHEDNVNAVGTYLFRKMGRLGLLVHMHQFLDREEASEGKLKDDFLTSSSGTNVVGILPGVYWGSSEDQPLIIGAHWDTVSTSPGYNDNGSGIAALLEVATAISRATCHRNLHTIIFVAFDAEEVGCHGSSEFVRSILIPSFVDKGYMIQGAIILDTLLNWDDREGTQEETPNWQQYTPKATEDIQIHHRKGDFLGLISRQFEADAHLARAFTSQYQRLGGRNGEKNKYRLVQFEIDSLPIDRFPTTSEMLNLTFFWRSDHSRFWYYHDERQFRSFGAILLSDTASYRGYMRSCYHKECDTSSNPNLRKKESMEFLAKTAQAVVLAILELTGGAESCDVRKIFGDDDANNEIEKTKEAPVTGSPEFNTTPKIPTSTETEMSSTVTTSSTTETTSTTTTSSTTETTTTSAATGTFSNPESVIKSNELSLGDNPDQILVMLLKHYLKMNQDSILAHKLSSAPSSETESKFAPRSDYDEKEVDVKDDESNDEEEEQMTSKHVTTYNGPFQPNYGNQYNIDHLTVAMNPTERPTVRKSSKLSRPKKTQRLKPKKRNHVKTSEQRSYSKSKMNPVKSLFYVPELFDDDSIETTQMGSHFRTNSDDNSYQDSREDENNGDGFFLDQMISTLMTGQSDDPKQYARGSRFQQPSLKNSPMVIKLMEE